MEKYQEMTNELVVKYIKRLNIFPKDHELSSKEVGDGNLNYVFRVQDVQSGKSVIVKQALPYLKIAGDGWKLTLDRNRIESEAMKFQSDILEGSVPKIYHHSDIYALTVMEDLGDMQVLRHGLMKMQKYPNFPKQIGKFMARNLFLSSDMGMSPSGKKQRVSSFISPELCDITEKLVLNDPYMDSDSNNVNVNIRSYVEELWNDKSVRLETAKLKNIFMTKAESLLHGDLHTGSIFIDQEKAIVFDTEFAFYGPYSYDIGLLFANIVLNYISWEGKVDEDKNKIYEYRVYLLKLMSEIWDEFCKEFDYLWKNESKDIITTIEGYEEYYIENLLHETIGFCSCEVMRRIIGMAHVPDLDEIENLQDRAKAQIMGLKIAQKMLLNRNSINSFNKFIDLIEEESR